MCWSAGRSACSGYLASGNSGMRCVFSPRLSFAEPVFPNPQVSLTGAFLSLTGISGKGPGASGNPDAPGSPAGAFARMSDSIPPLPPPQQPVGEEDEDDWES